MEIVDANLLPNWNIPQSALFYSGGVKDWGGNTAIVREAQQWLRDNNMPASSFVYYLLFVHVEKMPGDALNKLAVNMRNPDIREAFCEWFQQRGPYLRDLIKQQRQLVTEYVESGMPFRRVLLEEFASLSPVVRVELGLKNKARGGTDWEDILDVFGYYGFEVALGSPQYLWYCPFLRDDLVQGAESHVRRKVLQKAGSSAFVASSAYFHGGV